MDVTKLIEVSEKHAAAVPDLPDDPLYVDPENPEVSSGSKVRLPWRVETDDAAEWALRRKGEHDAEIARIRAQAEAAKAWIDRRAAALTAEAQRGASFFEAVLLEWMSRARSRILTGKAKSKKYLFGVIGVRSAPEKLVYDDEKAAMAWARAQGAELGLVRIDWKLEKDAVKAYAKRNQIVPPGARWEGGADEPYVKAESPALPASPPSASLSLVKETP